MISQDQTESENHSYRNISKIKSAKIITIISMVLNLLLAIAKITISFYFGSVSLLADGFDSALDLLASFFSFLALRLTLKPPDEDHRFGHHKFDNLFSLGIAMMLFISSGIIGYQAINRLITHEVLQFSIANVAIASISIVLKGLLVWLNLRIGKKIQSQVLIANGLNFRTDILTSMIVLISVSVGHLSIGTFSLYWVDPSIALLISIFIILTAINASKESIEILLDKSPEQEILDEVHAIVEKTEGVEEIKNLRLRKIGSKITGDIGIIVDSSLTIKEGHEISKKALERVKSEHPILNLIIHTIPEKNKDASGENIASNRNED
jgi:cation diffusion facilitator family transporter